MGPTQPCPDHVLRVCKHMCDTDSDPMQAKEGGGFASANLSPGSLVRFETFAVRDCVQVFDSRMYWSEFDREISSHGHHVTETQACGDPHRKGPNRV